MKTEPYIKATNSNSRGAGFICIPVKDMKLAFMGNAKNFTADSVYSDGSFSCLMSESGEPVEILSPGAASVSEFWLNAYAAGCAFDEDETAPKEPEIEIIRLKTRIVKLEDKIRQYKNTIMNICRESEDFDAFPGKGESF